LLRAVTAARVRAHQHNGCSITPTATSNGEFRVGRELWS